MEDGPVEKITTEVVMAPLNEPAPGPELEPEAELVPEAIVEPEPEPIGEPMELDEAPEEGPIAIGEEARRSPRTPEPRLPDVGPKTPPERPKRRSLGKKPLSPKIPIEEELEAEEAEREALRQGQLEAKAEAAREAEARRKAREKERAKSREERALAENKARAEAEAVAEAKAKAARARARARAKEDAVPEPESEAEEEEGEEDAEFVVEEVVEDEFEGEEEAEEEAAPPPSKKRRPPVQKEARRAQADHAEEGDTARKSRRKGGIPVIVHRLAKSSDAPLPPKSNRKGPNPADIIFTLFSQLIDAAYEKLQTNTEKVAVENFKEELASRLRQLTDTIENLINLQARVRQENKRKLQLQKEILEVRRQRNLVAAQMDDVRHQHDVASKQNDILHRAGATFEEISNIVEQGNAKSAGMPDDHDDTLFGLEAMIHKVLPLVTGGGSDGSGILSKVVEFNRDLERITEALREHNKARGLI
ncbi:hypothetical protein FN846DRAFT_372183 [Sphaerosporella brunnea]|uniref:Inner kinetochore subunit AME1 domain-containing protein n=1 Tax=Sphaerosporella brunnea TaxID=1250544 RepID=A0A5J5EGP1_9PEZI|nr:hypothetical protein FN846DRAFT_372183 [Sphaerosporella brunnea]